MSFIKKRRPWDSQPQEAVQLAYGRTGAVIHPPHRGSPINGQAYGASNNLIVPSSEGLVFQGAASTLTWAQVNRPFVMGTDVGATLVSRFRKKTGVTGDVICGLGATTGGSGNTLFRVIGGSAAKRVQMQVQDGAGGLFYNTESAGNVAIDDGNWHWLVVTLGLNSGDTLAYFIDGVADGTVSRAGGTPAATTFDWITCHGWVRGGAPLLGTDAYDIALVASIFERLPDGDAQDLSRNGWQLFAPQVIQVPVSAGGGPAAVGAATEADAALGLSAVQIAAAGRADETDASIALAAVQARATGRADESDSALALTAVQIGAVGLAAETDTALALAAGASNAVGAAEETDTALALPGVQIAAVGVAAEVEAALALTGVSGTAPGVATEADTAFALAAVQKLLVEVALETDTALALSPPVAPGSELELILKILRNRQELNATTGMFTLYDDDSTTVLYTVPAWADAAGTVPYNGGVLARIDRLE